MVNGRIHVELLALPNHFIKKEAQTLSFAIKNTDRSVGALLSNEISKAHGRDGLPADTLNLLFTGAAGQSFGCFATKGLHMEVTGNANDYFGKGLSGARLVAKVPETATFKPEENIMYSQPWSPMPSTTAVDPEFLTQKRSPAIPLMYASPAVAP